MGAALRKRGLRAGMGWGGMERGFESIRTGWWGAVGLEAFVMNL